MIKEKWKVWIKNEKLVNKDFKNYLKRKTIREEATEIEIKGHLSKAKRNLRFARKIIDELKNYREDATCSISIEYEKSLAENLGEKAIDFVNKAEKIINE